MSSNPADKKLAAKIKDLELKPAAYEKGAASQLISEEFRRLANRSQDIIYQFDLTTRQYLFVNNAGLEFYGIDVGNSREVTTKSVLFSVYPEDRDNVKKARDDSLAPGSTVGEVEYRQVRPDASLHWMHDRWIIIRDETGNPVIIEGIIRDNTDRKKAEAELIKHKEHLEELIEERTAELKTANDLLQLDIIERKRVEEEKRRSQEVTERLAKEMAIIAEVGRVIGSTLNIQEVYEHFDEEIRKLIPFDRLNVVTQTNPNDDTLTMTYVSGIDIPERRAGDVIPLHGSLSETIFKLRKGMINNYKDIEDMSKRIPLVTRYFAIKEGLISTMSIPLFYQDEVIGILNLLSKQPDAYTEDDLRLAERIGEQIGCAIVNAQLYDELRKTRDTLEVRVKERTIELEEINTALRVLLKKREEDRKNMEQTMQSNLNELVMPFIDKLKMNPSDTPNMTYLKIIETNLNNIVSPFINELSEAHRRLTPKEIQIASLVKQGNSSKEIAKIFGLSVGTVMTHRNNIRKKLKLKSKNSNLRSHLLFQR